MQEVTRVEALEIIEEAKNQRMSYGDNEDLDLENVNNMSTCLLYTSPSPRD